MDEIELSSIIRVRIWVFLLIETLHEVDCRSEEHEESKSGGRQLEGGRLLLQMGPWLIQ
jgi:hypothetical protein